MLKTTLLFTACFAITTSVFANIGNAETDDCLPMSGLYSLGGEEADFESFYDLTAALACGGIEGETTISIEPGLYLEDFTIGPIPGATKASLLTFKNANPENGTVKISSGMQHSGAVLTLSNAAFIHFEDLVFSVRKPARANAVKIESGSHSISFNRVSFEGTQAKDASAGAASMRILGSVHQVSINNCQFLNGSYSLIADGGTKETIGSSLSVKGSTFEGAYTGFVQIKHYSSPIIANCKFESESYASNFVALELSDNHNKLQVSKNQIKAEQMRSGIQIFNQHSHAGMEAEISNNSIENGKMKDASGILVDGQSDFIKIDKNTIQYTNGHQYNSFIRLLSASSNISMKDNRLYNLEGRSYTVLSTEASTYGGQQPVVFLVKE